MQASVCSPKTALKIAVAALLLLSASQPVVSQTVPTSTRNGQGQKLAPDALVIIESAAEQGETAMGPIDLPLVARHPELAWKPNYAPVSDTLLGKSKDVILRNEVHCLEFAFKPVRMIQVNDKLVWYLLYRVRNVGGNLKPDETKGAEVAVSREWVRFFPTFVLNSLSVKREYMDVVNPAAKAIIAAKERVGQPIYDSIEIQQQKIPVSTEADNHEVWGVATWQDVDPKTIFFSVRVKGLTNAQRIETDGPSLKFLQKQLVLNFVRPGDAVNEMEDNIRFGVPTVDNVALPVTGALPQAIQSFGLNNSNAVSVLKLSRALQTVQSSIEQDPVLSALDTLEADANDSAENAIRELQRNRALAKDSTELELKALTEEYRKEIQALSNKSNATDAEIADASKAYRLKRQLMLNSLFARGIKSTDLEQAGIEREKIISDFQKEATNRLQVLISSAISKSGAADADAWTAAIMNVFPRTPLVSSGQAKSVVSQIQAGVKGSIGRQDYILLQYGLKERLDHLWVYR